MHWSTAVQVAMVLVGSLALLMPMSPVYKVPALVVGLIVCFLVARNMTIWEKALLVLALLGIGVLLLPAKLL